MYKKIVEEIKSLPWSTYDPKAIIYTSKITAIEFGGTLREILPAFPGNQALAEMADGELMTNNLKYGEYNKYGDHSEFLIYFSGKRGIALPVISNGITNACDNYRRITGGFNRQEKAMTIFSREQELPGIFETILNAHDWAGLGLGFYGYYLKRHIELDSAAGGHGDLTKAFPLDEEVLYKFYTARLELYKSLGK